MASQPLTEYERRRLENIKRNNEMMASLKVHARATELSNATKRQRVETKVYKTTPEKKPKPETPIVIRRSLRARGIPPDSSTRNGIEGDLFSSPIKNLKSATQPNPLKSATQSSPSPRKLGPLYMRDVYISRSTDRQLIDTIEGMSENAPLNPLIKRELDGDKGYLDLRSLVLKPENIARIMPGRVFSVKFFPSNDRSMIVAGNKFGNVAFWDVEYKEGDNDGIYLYHPHTGPISGIVIEPFALSKVYTSCYDGFIRLMDVEKEAFNLVYSSSDSIFSLSQRPHDAKSLYFGKAYGELNVWDESAGKSSSSWILHEERINTIDFNQENTNLMATSSTDGTACIWDLRSVNANRPKPLKVVDHKRAVHSAYFSPSGSCLATTSINDKVAILSGVDFSDISMINHNNQTGRWISSFRAIWGWDDTYLFIGNMERGVDAISSINKEMVTLQSPLLSAIPCRFAAHPFRVGALAGATGGGQVYVWTSK